MAMGCSSERKVVEGSSLEVNLALLAAEDPCIVKKAFLKKNQHGDLQALVLAYNNNKDI